MTSRDTEITLTSACCKFLEAGEYSTETAAAVQVGLNHEQQHQELMLTDIKHVLSCNPTLPKYVRRSVRRLTRVQGHLAPL